MSKTRSRRWMGWLIAVTSTMALLGLVFAPPYVGMELRHTIMAGFSSVCHQIPGRSPQLHGVQLAVCHRCLGIYMFMALASIGFFALGRWDGAIHRHARWFILAAVLVPGADWAADVVGIYSNTPLSRLLTGGVFGLVAGYFVTRAVIGLMGDRKQAASTTADPEPVP